MSMLIGALIISVAAAFATALFDYIFQKTVNKFDVTPTGGKNGYYYVCVGSGVMVYFCGMLSIIATLACWTLYACARLVEVSMLRLVFNRILMVGTRGRIATGALRVQTFLYGLVPHSESLFDAFACVLPKGTPPSSRA